MWHLLITLQYFHSVSWTQTSGLYKYLLQQSAKLLLSIYLEFRFSARRHICRARRPSVCPSVTRVDQSKTVEVGIVLLSPQVAPWL